MDGMILPFVRRSISKDPEGIFALQAMALENQDMTEPLWAAPGDIPIGSSVLVATYEGRVVGFLTLNVEDGVARQGVLFVDPELRDAGTEDLLRGEIPKVIEREGWTLS